MVQQITGYKFQVEAAAVNAQNALRVHYLGNRPAPPQGETWTTTEWVEVQQGTFEGQSFFWFEGDFSPVLGNPTTFDIDVDEI